MIPRPKIVLMPIWVPPNMATVPKTLPTPVWLWLLLPGCEPGLVDDGSGMKKPIR